MKRLIFLAALCFLASCNQAPSPKPPAYLSLEYPNADYEVFQQASCPFSFEANTLSEKKWDTSCRLTLSYSSHHADIFITYKPVQDNLQNLLRDAQNLTQKHVVKAESITEQPFVNKAQNVFGMLYEVSGNAASLTQFYLTDSLQHFLTGSVYFRVQPNYDSLLPAAAYLKNDVVRLVESLQWK